MKKILSLAIIVLFVVSCNQNQRNNANDRVNETEQVTIERTQTPQAEQHRGTYKGTVPCADCEGIETVLELKANNEYVRKMKYLGKGDGKEFEEKGRYSWNDAGNTITLEGVTESPNKYWVEQNQLVQLDMDGNAIDGELANNYILRRQ